MSSIGSPYLLGAQCLSQAVQQTASPAPKALPSAGFLPGQVFLNPKIAPTVPAGAARPFAPGEYVKNPNGSWSSEITVTVADPRLNNGQPTNLPSLWIVNGKPYRAKNEDEATDLAIKSGLSWPSHKTMAEATAASNTREKNWQTIEPQNAGSVPPLWTVPGKTK